MYFYQEKVLKLSDKTQLTNSYNRKSRSMAAYNCFDDRHRSPMTKFSSIASHFLTLSKLFHHI